MNLGAFFLEFGVISRLLSRMKNKKPSSALTMLYTLIMHYKMNNARMVRDNKREKEEEGRQAERERYIERWRVRKIMLIS